MDTKSIKTKALAIIASVLMITTGVVPAFAADAQHFSGDGNTTVPVRATITSSYTVQLPALITLTPDTEDPKIWVAAGHPSVIVTNNMFANGASGEAFEAVVVSPKDAIDDAKAVSKSEDDFKTPSIAGVRCNIFELVDTTDSAKKINTLVSLRVARFGGESTVAASAAAFEASGYKFDGSDCFTNGVGTSEIRIQTNGVSVDGNFEGVIPFTWKKYSLAQ